ncbi:MAG: DUF6691 family protein [Planctomycetota bacterium]|jgi:uncharacterized membrane protein YedE/YeeE|nr:YeeE/YedE thiosulfate transporter family protein [Gammaproteobacteria bacterium]MDH3857817.1 YeeE/YedE thiosulfate transporter family protein [Gammaproteobacteria bacterium]
MRYIPYLMLGIVFGFALIKSEAASWYRIMEMFHFQSFKMYGVIITAVLTAFVGVELIKRFTSIKSIEGSIITIPQKAEGKARFPLGGLIFGLGWGMIGLCPGPIFALVGAGSIGAFIVLLGALHGTWLYGLVRNKLPH